MYSLPEFQIESTTKSGGLLLRHIVSGKIVFVSKRDQRMFLQGLYGEELKIVIVEEKWTDKNTGQTSAALVAKIDYNKVLL